MRVLIFAAAVFGIAPPALGCPGLSEESHFFFENPPASILPGLRIIRVRVIDPKALTKVGSRVAMVELLSEKAGPPVRLRLVFQAPFTSCDRWGYVTGPAYVVGPFQRDAGSHWVFAAQSYSVGAWSGGKR